MNAQRISSTLTLVALIIGIISSGLSIRNDYHSENRADAADKRSSESEIYEIVQKSMNSKDPKQEKLALIMVRRLEDSSFRSQMLSMFEIAESPKVRAQARRILSDEEAYREFEKFDLKANLPLPLTSMVQVVNKIHMKFYWCSDKLATDDGQSNASTRNAIAREYAIGLYGNLGTQMVRQLTINQANANRVFGTNVFLYKEGFEKVAENISLDDNGAMATTRRVIRNIGNEDISVVICGETE